MNPPKIAPTAATQIPIFVNDKHSQRERTLSNAREEVVVRCRLFQPLLWLWGDRPKSSSSKDGASPSSHTSNSLGVMGEARRKSTRRYFPKRCVSFLKQIQAVFIGPCLSEEGPAAEETAREKMFPRHRKWPFSLSRFILGSRIGFTSVFVTWSVRVRDGKEYGA